LSNVGGIAGELSIEVANAINNGKKLTTTETSRGRKNTGM